MRRAAAIGRILNDPPEVTVPHASIVFILVALPLTAATPVEAPPTSLRSEPLHEAHGTHGAHGPGEWSNPEAGPTAVTDAPLPAAYCQIKVNGVNHDTETDYIPHVIQCENGGANLQALKAQAIAARSVAYYAMAENGGICDGQGCQVYSCNADPLPIHHQAAEETAGQYLSFNNNVAGRVLTYAFFVSGDNDQTADCHGVSINANTENYVTYNEGKTWTGVKETSLGFQYKDPNQYGYGQNRGCMSQWSARCLENNKGYNHEQIIRYFYGADIEIAQAEGPCVAGPGFAAKYVAQSFPLASQPAVVMVQGETLEAWIDLSNEGEATWTGNTKLAPTPRDVASPLAHALWLSPTRITAPDVDTPPGAVGRFSFQIAANEPGDYYQTFGLVEENVTWFSEPPLGGGPPDDQLEIHVIVEPAPVDPSTTSAGETGNDETGGQTSVTTAPPTDPTSGPGSGSITDPNGATDSDGQPTGGATEQGGEGGSAGSTDSDGAGPYGTFSDTAMGNDDSGCGCRSTGDRTPWLLAALLLLVPRRRRHSRPQLRVSPSASIG